MSVHRIHLRGPWEYRWNDGVEAPLKDPTKTGTVAMPLEWREIFGEASGSAQFCRKFHCPTNLDPHERVFLVFTELRGSGEIHLNDVFVGPFAGSGELVEFEITNSMKPFNELTVDITFDPAGSMKLAGGLYGVVALEIRAA